MSRIRCGAAGAGDWMPYLSVNQDAGQREKPGADRAGRPGHQLRRAGRPERDINAVSQFRVCILRRPHLKANYITTPCEGWPNSKAPPNAAHKCGLLCPLLGGCTATVLCVLTFPKILCPPEKVARKSENGDIVWRRLSLSRGVDCDFRGAGLQNSWREGKTSGDATRQWSKR